MGMGFGLGLGRVGAKEELIKCRKKKKEKEGNTQHYNTENRLGTREYTDFK